MKNNATKRTRIVLSALGLAAIIPLIAVPASAGLGSGEFQIKAISSSDTTISGVTGIGGKTGNPGEPGEGEGPGPTDPAAIVLATYSCGPVSIEITDKMVELSKSNEALLSAGREGEMVAHADGWKLISSTTSGAFATFPADGTKPAQMKLIPSTSGASIAYAVPYGTGCNILDNRAPAAGETYSYSTGYGAITEGKTLLEEGELRQVRVADNSSQTSVTRTAPSNKYPTSITKIKSTNDLNTVVTLPAKRDGTEKIYVEAKGNGDMMYRYQTSVPGELNDAASPTKSEPTFIWLYGTGLIRTISYNDQNGVEQTYMPSEATYAAQVAGYNARSGQSWDGKLIKISELETAIPFMPVAP